MQYRTFGNLNLQVSALGFGAMRLPTLEGDHAQIDIPHATRMLHYAIDNDINYVDTAYGYHRGASETVIGNALKNGYRDRVKLATKMPCWLVKSREDFDTYFNEQLKRLQTSHIDFYLLHSLKKETWQTVHNLDVLDWAEKKMNEGCIGHLGFSFHDTYEVFQEIVDAYPWSFCQIQYNYMDEEYQAGTRGLKYAADKGLAVVVMEPIRGGQLSRSPPQEIMDLWNASHTKREPADWALQWVWNHPEVSVVLSGMSTMDHVKQNIMSAQHSGANTLSVDDLALVGRVRDKYLDLTPIPCTKCEYCMPCASGVKIPEILELYNEAMMYNDIEYARRVYTNFFKEEERADKCTKDRECEEKCPQSIKIPEWLEKVHKILTED